MFVRNSAFAVINTSFQASAIILSTNGILWPMFIVMCMMGYVTLMQTIAAAAFFSGYTKNEDAESKEVEDHIVEMRGILMLVSGMYIISSYQTYILGYEFYAGIMACNAVVYFLTNLFGKVKYA